MSSSVLQPDIAATGRIAVSSGDQKPGWYYLLIDNDFSLYYRHLCAGVFYPKWNLPLNGCHMTFIAGEKEDRYVDISELGSFLLEDIEFFYQPVVVSNGESFWIDCRCPRLDEIRSSLGLPSKWNGYHVTLGNFKHKRNQP